ncbi:MAG: FAD-dependent oxidoreductase [Candidatus Delongbacteria bacterium]|jgi:glutamate synthase (NADPH/NADH) small chain|nr:FAD-dependent oxidoreductase [Candidatus Delongbacteria bacterium]
MSLKDLISPFYAWKRVFEKPYTIKDPVNREGAPTYRGFHTNDIEQCIGCGSCEEICQNESIDMVEVANILAKPGDSGLRPLIDYGRCCWCALCVDICPTKSLGMSNEFTWIDVDPEVYRFVPGVDKMPWENEVEKGYKRGEEAWLISGVREQMPEQEADERKTTFDEFQDGFTDEQAIIEANRCLDCGICVEACPTHMDIPKYIKAIRDGELDEGLRIMFQTNPMVEACGRICTAKCETVCAVGHEGKPIAIRWLKRYIGDKTFDRKDEIIGLKPKPASGKKVGIIGGGPAGLTAAYYLRTLGHDAVIYEMHDKLGGMLKYGIPDYRLPANVLQREIDYIIRQDVEVKYNTKVGKDVMLDDIHKENDAVFVCIGAQLGTNMEIEGLHEDGVQSGVGFLEKIGKGERPDLGKDVVVVGGGNTAMDCCRSSVRLGSDVKILYRRTEKEMPADDIEIIEAKEEGVDIQILTSPIKIQKKNGRLAIECIKMELGEPDKSGRRRPEPVKGSEYTIMADTCIMAVGQKVEPEIMKDLDIKLTRWGTFEVNTDTLKSNQAGVYAGGDCETGPDDAIRAIAAGKKAAYFIDKQFKG